jgi:hypothetical protein
VPGNEHDEKGKFLPIVGDLSKNIGQFFAKGNEKPAMAIKAKMQQYIDWAGGHKALTNRQRLVLDELQILYKKKYMVERYLFGLDTWMKDGDVVGAFQRSLALQNSIEKLRKEFAEDVKHDDKTYDDWINEDSCGT